MDILSVAELTFAIKKQLESRFSYLAVRGEISNCKHQSSGHIYFTLKDAEAQVSVVLFKGSSSGLNRLPKDGDQIIVRGELSLYVPRGNYQIVARDIEYAGSGELLQKLQALKEKLQKRGWFAPELKKKLPRFPKTIGVVTSPTGSVIQDILQVLSRRFSGFHLILNPVRVQGEGAAAEIARAIEEFNRYELVDVLIVGRGGGSLEDLWPFNEEIVAAAIQASKIPIVSAVGHETDFCIADFVADVRAPTPSAAAEMITVEKNEQLIHLSKMKVRFSQTLQSHLRRERKALFQLAKQPVLASPRLLLTRYAQGLDEQKENLNFALSAQLKKRALVLQTMRKQIEFLSPQSRLIQMRSSLEKGRQALEWRMRQILGSHKARLHQLTSHLQAIDPRHLLTKGYAIVFRENSDSVIFSKHEVEPAERLRLQLKDGQLLVHVDQVDP